MTRSAPSMKALRIANCPDRAAAPYRDHVAGFDVAEFGGHVAGRKNIREKQRLFVVERVRHLDRPLVRVRHAKIFGLPAAIAAEKMRIAEKPRGRMAPQRLGFLMIRICALAGGIKAALAEAALAAGNGEGHDDAVADLQAFDRRSDLDDFAHGLMAQHVAAVHLRNDAVIDVNIRAADGAGRDLDHGVARILDHRIWNAFATDVALAVKGERLHVPLLPLWPHPRWGTCRESVGSGPAPIAAARATASSPVLSPAHVFASPAGARAAQIGLWLRRFPRRSGGDHRGRAGGRPGSRRHADRQRQIHVLPASRDHRGRADGRGLAADRADARSGAADAGARRRRSHAELDQQHWRKTTRRAAPCATAICACSSSRRNGC